ncbi:Membrane dipeptidase [Sulfidibacter corallicola]|uniref:Membrane dipeptidase n=1 Tax=Sulfidibacter corallicola TaxID=2818388 RepID=A0A8A4TMK8_SULCO|nr:membrane dipeptidase [Sulfidibacter corallicola]QTD50138.1 membrane dipeptidase [Sulfidibacter corallicola]
MNFPQPLHRHLAFGSIFAFMLCALTPTWGQECRDTSVNLSFDDIIFEILDDNGPARITPRRLVTNQSGTTGFPFRRLFFQVTPMDIDQVTLKFYKRGGGARTTITVCATDEQGAQDVLHHFDVPSGSGDVNRLWNLTCTGVKNKRLSIHLQPKSWFATLDYEILLVRPDEGQVWQPDAYDYDEPVQGFADLHVHQAADLAYAAGWYHGSHEAGHPSQTLPPCEGDDHGSLQIDGVDLFNVHVGETSGYPDFEHWPAWDDIAHQQVAADWLKQAHDNGLNLMVASVVNNEWLCAATVATGNYDRDMHCNDMESVKRQILALKRFDAAHDWYQIVRDPWEARRAIEQGRLAVVLSVEVSDLFPTSDGDYLRQLHELYSMDVRSIQLAHETNNVFAGAAYHRDIFEVMSQIKAWFRDDVDYVSDGDGIHNPIGLTEDGEVLVDEMIRLNMLIDLAHLSLETQRDLFQIVANQHDYYPLYNSHTRISNLLTTQDAAVLKEHVTTDEVLGYVRRTGGMLGLRTGDNAMLDYVGSEVPNNCDGSARSFIQFYEYAVDQGVSVGFGSDLNGFITQMTPRFGPEACATADADRASQAAAQGAQPTGPDHYLEYLHKGLAHVGLLPAVVHDMQVLNVDATALDQSAEMFLKMWERTYDAGRGPLP